MQHGRRARRFVTSIPIAMALMLIAASTGSAQTAPASGSASQVAAFTSRRVTLRGVDRELLPALLKPAKAVTVMVEVSGDSVATQQGAARQQGRSLSDSERASARGRTKADQDRIRPQIEAQGGQVLSQMQDAYNGMRVRVDAGKLPAIASISGVTGVHALTTYKLDNVHGAPYVNADDVWTSLGDTGEGMKVAIIDTGVDYTHANFGGSGNPADFTNNDPTVRGGTFPTAKVVEGYDFAGDAYDAGADPPNDIPHPDPDPIDCEGHGSHVAGTAAGDGVLANGSTFTGPYNANTYSNNFTVGPGVAPKASILAYKVFGCEGSTNVVVEAINQAVADGADVINMSLGHAYGRTDTDPDVAAVENATAAGVVVVLSAGNDGNIPYIVGGASTADHAISVAAMEALPSLPAANIALSGPLNLVALNSNAATIAGGGVTAPLLVLDGSGPSGAGPDGIGLGCDPGDFAGASGKIVVTQRGVCARIDRATNGQAAGAVAVIMVNNAAGLPPLDGDYPGLTIPFIGIGDEHANDLKTRNGQNATLTAAGVIANPNYQTLADFSSGGPRQGDSALKPDVTAPGVSVYSTSIGTGTGGTYISGTSMASPHTAGVAALVVKNHPTWSAAQVRAAIMNNANPNLVTNADVMQAGAGVVDALDAINTRVVAMTENDGASLSYGYQMLSGAFTSTKTITLTNFGNTAATYNLTTSKQDSLSYALVTAPASQVTVPAASGGNPGHATVNVKISLSKAQVAQLPFADDTSPSAANDIQFRSPHGAITFAPTGSGTSLRVPFLLVPRATSTIVPTPSGQNLSLKNNGVHTGFADLLAWTYNDPADVPGEPVDIRAMGAMVLGPSNMGLAQGDRSIFFAVNTWNRWSSPGGDVEFDIGIDTGGSPAPDFFVFGYDGGQLFDDAYDGQYLSIIVTPSGHFVDAWTTDAPLNGSTLILPVAASDLGLTKNGVNQFSISNLNGFSLTNNAVDHVNVPGGGAAVIRPWAPPLAQGFSAQLTPGQTTSTLLKFQQQAKNDHLLGWMVISMDDANGAPQADTIRFPT